MNPNIFLFLIIDLQETRIRRPSSVRPTLGNVRPSIKEETISISIFSTVVDDNNNNNIRYKPRRRRRRRSM